MGGAGRVASGWDSASGARANADAGCTKRYAAATGFVMVCVCALSAERVDEGEGVPLRA